MIAQGLLSVVITKYLTLSQVNVHYWKLNDSLQPYAVPGHPSQYLTT